MDKSTQKNLFIVYFKNPPPLGGGKVMVHINVRKPKPLLGA